MLKRGKTQKIPLVVFLFTTVVLLAILFFRPLSRLLKTAVVPLWQSRQAATDAGSRLLQSKKAMQEELARLEQELTESRLQLLELSRLADENRELRQSLGREDNIPIIGAGILTLPHQSLYNTFEIDAGARQGISVGARVFVGTSTLIGTVTDVTDRSATVTSLASPGQQTSAYVAGSNVAVTVTGRGGGDFEVELPRDIAFETGMAIVSQGVHPYTIAIIERIISDPRDPFQKLLARMPVNVRAVRWVAIEKK